MIRSSGSMWVFGSLRLFMESATDFEDWRLSHDVVWEKHKGSGFATDRFRNVHEIVGHFYLRGARWGEVYKLPQTTPEAIARSVRRRPRKENITGARDATDYRSEDGGPLLMRSVVPLRSEHRRSDHPTQKPEPGGAVLDPFAGSGTTGVVARRLGLDATLIEARAEYVDVIYRRLENDAPLLTRCA